MRQITVAKEKFDFKKFVKEALKFNKAQMSPEVDPSYCIIKAKDGRWPKYCDEHRENFMEELEEGYYLFFRFASGEYRELIRCLDGGSIIIGPRSNICIGELEEIGYLFQLKNGKFIINSASHCFSCIPPPAIIPKTNCGIFAKPMKEYIEKFIKE